MIFNDIANGYVFYSKCLNPQIRIHYHGLKFHYHDFAPTIVA